MKYRIQVYTSSISGRTYYIPERSILGLFWDELDSSFHLTEEGARDAIERDKKSRQTRYIYVE